MDPWYLHWLQEAQTLQTQPQPQPETPNLPLPEEIEHAIGDLHRAMNRYVAFIGGLSPEIRATYTGVLLDAAIGHCPDAMTITHTHGWQFWKEKS